MSKCINIDDGAWSILNQAKQVMKQQGQEHPSHSDAIRFLDECGKVRE